MKLVGGLKGGKGGFGSLLRSMNPKKKPTENFDACRDLSGRRVRNVQNEQRLEEWRRKHEEEEKYITEELKQYDKKKKAMNKEMRANNYKIDEKYKKMVSDGATSMVESLNEARKNASGVKKRDLKKKGKKAF
mmetsp:Transcript_22291/g.21509  ORF Transcript_22291/g.21509 Transcript_22291/m.21509 type:complete len:133 (+) Transcript_22291:71-469(+)|eukprot:CAMPEP_0170557980 /NCGR_PEP_ID=MMETSP0211-20121228/31759_1 /TAXON_ID=311385 /ORGANISM="Pseudokeronopsis sp., Strain OXSARD2" /LENGTH=132 /DNA_ID=CAMNT_0010869481 /DNA_START=113 /DNA_END=511 /DNA_ORIENTATION=+